MPDARMGDLEGGTSSKVFQASAKDVAKSGSVKTMRDRGERSKALEPIGHCSHLRHNPEKRIHDSSVMDHASDPRSGSNTGWLANFVLRQNKTCVLHVLLWEHQGKRRSQFLYSLQARFPPCAMGSILRQKSQRGGPAHWTS